MNNKIDKPSLSLLKEKYKGKDYEDIIERIVVDNYPVQYAIGNVPFYGSIINVDERALIPRFETELLVDIVYKKIKGKKLNILDLCTGSGCIAISLKNKSKDFNITGVDISEKALSLAKENAKLNNTEVEFIKKDILKDHKYKKKYDVIISNPPYVKLSEYVSPNTKYEPQNALYAGSNNLIFYETIVDYAKDILNDKFIIAFEINNKDGRVLKELAEEKFTNAKVSLLKDYNKLDRFLIIENE